MHSYIWAINSLSVFNVRRLTFNLYNSIQSRRSSKRALEWSQEHVKNAARIYLNYALRITASSRFLVTVISSVIFVININFADNLICYYLSSLYSILKRITLIDDLWKQHIFSKDTDVGSFVSNQLALCWPFSETFYWMWMIEYHNQDFT